MRGDEDRFRSVVERIPAVTYVEELREGGKSLRYMSPQYGAMLRYSPEEDILHQDHWLKIIHPEDRERVLDEDTRRRLPNFVLCILPTWRRYSSGSRAASRRTRRRA